MRAALIICLISAFFHSSYAQEQDSTVYSKDVLFIDSSVVAIDSSTIIDSTITEIKRDSLAPIKLTGFSSEKDFTDKLDKTYLEKLDYRFTGDFFKHTNHGFLFDLGYLGQPSETSLYGLGFNNIGYSRDGVYSNNRIINSVDLNDIQSENIEYIEILPLPRGFLYGGSNNNISAVNIVTKDRLDRRPYTRIRFYQAPNNEGMVDGQFSAIVFPRINLYFDVTNKSIERYYPNTESGGWKAHVKVKHFLNNNLNFIADYNYVRTETQLFGGIASDSILKKYPNYFNDVFYDVFGTIIENKNTYKQNLSHNYSFKILAKNFNVLRTDLVFYYKSELQNYRQNEHQGFPGYKRIFRDNKAETIGIDMRESVETSFFYFDGGINYEKINFTSPLLIDYSSLKTFSLRGKISFRLFNDFLIPSGFVKVLNYDNASCFGLGADATLNLNRGISLYGGASFFEKPISALYSSINKHHPDFKKQNISTMQLSAKYHNGFINAGLTYFLTRIDKELSAIIVDREAADFIELDNRNISGIGADMELNLFFLTIETKGTYYETNHKNKIPGPPQFKLNGGVYYKNILFNENLDLKTGFYFEYTGTQNYYYYDFEKFIKGSLFSDSYANIGAFYSKDIQINETYKMDFIIIGKIQNSATLFFIWENLLNRNYYIAPYFPASPRGIRFGFTWEFLD